MSRVKWKAPYIEPSLLVQINNDSTLKKEIQTVSRKSVIVPQFIGITFQVHNGRTFSKLKITEDMIGHKLGEFVKTRLRTKHKTKKKSK